MAEVTRTRQGGLVRAVFQVLLSHPDGLPASQVIADVERRTPPTPFEQSDYAAHPGVRRFDKIVRFSTIPAVKAGWLIKTKGQWRLTEEGRRALDRFTDPAELMRESVRLYHAWQKREEVPVDVTGETPAESAAITLEEAEEAAWSEISRHLLSMNPYEFQDLVAGLLRAMGYHISWVSPPGPDQGLDILAYTDPLGATGPRIKVQVKRRADKVGVEGIRAFMSLLGQLDVGIFVCTGGFTPDAEREARAQENRRLSLIGLDRLFDLWVEHYEQITEPERRLLPLKRVHFLAPLE